MAMTRTLEDGTVQTYIAGFGWRDIDPGTGTVTGGTSTPYDETGDQPAALADPKNPQTTQPIDYREGDDDIVYTIDPIEQIGEVLREGDGLLTYNTATGTNRMSDDTALAYQQQFISGWAGAGYPNREVTIGDYTNGQYVGEGEDPRFQEGSGVDSSYDSTRAEREARTDERTRILREQYGITEEYVAANGFIYTNQGALRQDENGLPTGGLMSLEQAHQSRYQDRFRGLQEQFASIGGSLTYRDGYHYLTMPNGEKRRYSAILSSGKMHTAGLAEAYAEATGAPQFSGNIWDPYGEGGPLTQPGPNPNPEPPGPPPPPPGPPPPPPGPPPTRPRVPPPSRPRPVFTQPYLADEFYKDWLAGWEDMRDWYGPPEGGLVPEGGIDVSRYFNNDFAQSLRPGAMGYQPLLMPNTDANGNPITMPYWPTGNGTGGGVTIPPIGGGDGPGGTRRGGGGGNEPHANETVAEAFGMGTQEIDAFIRDVDMASGGVYSYPSPSGSITVKEMAEATWDFITGMWPEVGNGNVSNFSNTGFVAKWGGFLASLFTGSIIPAAAGWFANWLLKRRAAGSADEDNALPDGSGGGGNLDNTGSSTAGGSFGPLGFVYNPHPVYNGKTGIEWEREVK
jgi:hypothetical protein